MTRSNGQAKGVGKGLKKKMNKQRGGQTFIDVESGGWPVHAPFPKQRVAKPGGANRSTEIINFKKFIKYKNKYNTIIIFID